MKLFKWHPQRCGCFCDYAIANYHTFTVYSPLAGSPWQFTFSAWLVISGCSAVLLVGVHVTMVAMKLTISAYAVCSSGSALYDACILEISLFLLLLTTYVHWFIYILYTRTPQHLSFLPRHLNPHRIEETNGKAVFHLLHWRNQLPFLATLTNWLNGTHGTLSWKWNCFWNFGKLTEDISHRWNTILSQVGKLPLK